MRRWTGALGILISALFVISLSVTSHLIVTDLGAAGEGAAPGVSEPILGASVTTQEVVSLSPGITTLIDTPDADSYVCPERPTKNYEGAVENPDDYDIVKVGTEDYYGTLENRRGYYKFDLTREIPEGAIIENARFSAFTFYGGENGGRPGPWGEAALDVSVVGIDNDDWIESTICWNNAPLASTMDSLPVLDTVYIPDTPGWDEDRHWWDVTSFVQDQWENDPQKVVTLGLFSENEGVHPIYGNALVPFTSKEGGYWGTGDPPYYQHSFLEVTWTPPNTGVKVEIFPKHGEAFPGGGKITCYIVTVTNKGDSADNFTLENSSSLSWGLELADTSFTNVPSLESRTTTLTVTIPSGAALGTVDNITVKATSQENSLVSDNDICTARASTLLKPPSDDTYVSQGFYGEDNTENWNFGREGGMAVGPRVEQKWQFSYLKFDLSGIPSLDNIGKATLFLRSFWIYPAGETITVAVCEVGDAWAENEITWETKPENGAMLDNEVVDLEDKWYLWDVTDYAKAQFLGDKIMSLCVRTLENDPITETATKFITRDYADPTYHPRLDLTPSLPSITVIKPTYWNKADTREALPGGKPHFTVEVTNAGVGIGDFNLTAGDSLSWNPQVEENEFLSLGPGESATTEVWVTIPENASPSTSDAITVTASTLGGGASDFVAFTVRVTADVLWPPEDDAQVSEGYPDNNFGIDSDMYIQSFTENFKNERIFIKYDLRGIPGENYIQSAELYLWCFGTYADDINAQACAVENDNWIDDTITWNNQPAIGDVIGENTLTDWPENVENTWIAWDVTSYVAGEHRYGDNFASFCIKAEVENTSGQYLFDSKDYQDKVLEPYLKVTLGSAQPDVSVSISPVHRIGNPNDTVTYEVKVMNTGNVMDSYTLDNADDQGWTMTLVPNSFTDVKPGESRTATLSVTLSGTQGDEDSIQVTATGTASDSENCTASVKRVRGWEVAGYAPRIDNYGVAVTGVGSGSYIYVANSNTLGTRVNLMRYDTSTGEWDYRATPPIATPFKNGTVLAWDGSDYIYTLCGGSYNDIAANSSARHYFFRYQISTNTWENLMPTGNTDDNTDNTGAQGAGDAMVVAGENVYAIVGQNEIGSTFWTYNYSDNVWTQLSMDWDKTDDGCSLVWTGGDDLYALRGEWQETTPSTEFARYSISDDNWTPLENIPEPGGVGDGASLLWIGGDDIHATGGSQAYEPPENEGLDDNFYAYSISGDSWTQLENLPAGIGAQNGPRLGAGSDIYAWRGCESDSVLWVYTTWTGTVDFSLVNLYTVNVEKILDLGQGSKLVVKFLTYGDGYENENVIDNFTIPPVWHVEENESARHPGIGGVKKSVKKARLDLTSDDTSGVISTIDTLVVTKVILEIRFSKIPLAWALAPTPAEKLELEIEFSKIPLAWALAPS